MTPTPKRLLRDLDTRDEHVCVWTGVDTGRLVPQHRQGGAGGRKDKHRIENLLWLDSLLNGLIESDAGYQAEAKRRGIKISLHADPLLVPVQFPDGNHYQLHPDGTRTKLLPADAAEMRALAGIGPGDGVIF